MTSSWAEILDILSSARITDLLVPTWIDRSASQPKAQAMFSTVFLELDEGEGYLRLSSVNSHGGLRWQHVEVADLSEHLLEDEDPADTFLTSLANQYFGESTEVVCVAVSYMTNEDSNMDEGIVRCAELRVTGDQRIFFDPMWTHGIRIGVAGAAQEWMKQYEHGPWVMEQHTWTWRSR